MSDMPRGYATSRLRPSSTLSAVPMGVPICRFPTVGGRETEAVVIGRRNLDYNRRIQNRMSAVGGSVVRPVPHRPLTVEVTA